jgi:predicted ATPase
MDGIVRPAVQEYGGTSLHRQSHGEAFMAVLANKLHGNGLYFSMTGAALSPSRQLSALIELHRLSPRNRSSSCRAFADLMATRTQNHVIDTTVSQVAYEETDHTRSRAIF